MRGRTLLIAGLLTAAFAGQAAAQKTVVGSPHDLSAASLGTAINDNNGEICVYCHTPHGADNTLGPLWNKPATGTVYTSYDSATMDGDITAGIGSVSMACLTCHDGTQAVDTVINAPNSGFGTVGGSPADIYLGDGTTVITGAANIGNTGGDLTNDHPIGMIYAGQSGVDPDFVTGTALNGSGTGPWWIDTEGTPNTTRDKTDMILYARVGNDPYVECATCHDPHAGDTGLTTEVNFMRLSNDGSDVCLACHIK